MLNLSDCIREASFLLKQRHLIWFFIAIFLLSVFSVWSGMAEINAQHQTIERLKQKDHIDREDVRAAQSSYGGAAYYSFHLTYSEPSALAFAAIGQRDVYPWKHRIRMLALEGQIYETDADNPELSFLGRFDFAFLVSVLLPLFVILLLHDLRSGEREAGRFDLLVVTARTQRKLWNVRALVLSVALAVACLIPFIIGAVMMAAAPADIVLIALVVLAHLAFWVVLTTAFTGAMRVSKLSSASVASLLLASWLVLTVVIPVSSDAVINRTVTSPNGGEIVLVQREAVNDAWDVPFDVTWQAFLATHPEWADKTAMESLFAWKWYYAFQQVGDQTAYKLSQAYRDAIAEKDALASTVSWFSPPMLTQRLLTALAETDIDAAMEYEQSVRDFHGSLRQFYYPLLFNEPSFDVKVLQEMPDYSHSSNQDAE